MHREIHHIAGTIFNFGVFSLNQTTFNFKKKNPLLFDSTLTIVYDSYTTYDERNVDLLKHTYGRLPFSSRAVVKCVDFTGNVACKL